MFGKNKGAALNKIDTLLGQNTVLKGNDIEYSGTIKIMGTVHGRINPASESDTTAIVSTTGTVFGALVADHVLINGTLVGDVVAKKSLIIEKNAKITGDICYGTITIQAGAVVHGQLKVFTSEESSTVGSIEKVA